MLFDVTAAELSSLPLAGEERELVSRPWLLVHSASDLLHGDPGCRWASGRAAPFTASLATLVRTRSLCSCFDRHTSAAEVKSLLEELEGLAELLVEEPLGTVWLPDRVEELENLRLLRRDHEQRLDLRSSPDPFPGVRAELLRRLSVRISFLERDLSSPAAQAEATRFLALLAAAAAPAVDGAVPKDAFDDLPGIGVAGDSAVSSARAAGFNAWLRSLAHGASRATAQTSGLDALLDSARSKPLRVEQLPATLPRPPHPGEATLEYLGAVWESGVEAEYARMEAGWFAEFSAAETAAPSSPRVLLLVELAKASDLFTPVAAACFSVGRAPEGYGGRDVRLLCLPEVLADALCSVPRRANGTVPDPEFLLLRLPTEPGDTREILETALGLWEAGSPGPLGSLEGALDTARAAF